MLREDGEDHGYGEGEEDGAGEVAEFLEEGPHGHDFSGWGEFLVTTAAVVADAGFIVGVGAGGVGVAAEEEHEG